MENFPNNSNFNADFDSDEANFEAMKEEFLETDPIVVCIIAALQQEETSQRHPKKKRKEKPRQILEGGAQLQRDYFDAVPVYPEYMFRRRFRMRRSFFVRMAEELSRRCPFFRQKEDAAMRLDLTSYQKITAAIRLIAYDTSADSLEEYLRISANSGLNSLKTFSRAIMKIFGGRYLREPNKEDIRQLNTLNTRRGFPGTLGSIDYMHWRWKNYPTAWAGQYQNGHKKEPSIVLQAVASQNLWIWHAYFGATGCNNDINVLEESHLFDSLLEGEAPACHYQINEKQYNMGYYLADGIYPPWACFVKTIPSPLSQKQKAFAHYQEAVRKDVERSFGVLQSRWHILRGSARLWDQEDLKYIMLACIILHNMIVEDESPEDLESKDFPMAGSEDPPPPLPLVPNPTLNDFQDRCVSIRNKQTHNLLQNDLIEHIWQFYGSNEV